MKSIVHFSIVLAVSLLFVITAIGQTTGLIMFRPVSKDLEVILNTGRSLIVSPSDAFPLLDKDATTGFLKLGFAHASFYARPADFRLVPESELRAALEHYKVDSAQLSSWEAKDRQNAAQSRQQQPASTPTAPAPAPQPSNVTIEPLYTWDVTVHIGRKYWATKDKYELYSSLTTEVQAKTRSEAERIAASRSYTTNSALFGSRIEVQPAGTEGVKFRVYNCEATRQ